MPFIKQLKKLGIDPQEYLNKAKAAAKRAGLNPDKLKFSTNHNKKLDYDGVDFGAYGYNDYIIYTLLNDPKKEEYRMRYQKSHSKIKDSGALSPNQLSLKINW